MHGIREVQWRVIWMWLLALAVSIAITVGLQSLGVADPPWFTVPLIPFIVLFGGLRMAYRRGVRDSEEHSRNI
jgi:hypothetical protein